MPLEDDSGAGGGAGLLAEYADRKQLAKELGVSLRTLARYDSLREGPPRMLLAGRVFYHRALAAEWLKARLSEVT